MRIKIPLMFFLIVFLSACTNNVHKPKAKKAFPSYTNFSDHKKKSPSPQDYVESSNKDAVEEISSSDSDVEVKKTSLAELSPSMISGVWNVSLGEKVCRIATPQTRYSTGFRAGPLRCPDPLSRVQYWRIVDNQLIFYDRDGDSLLVFTLIEGQRFQSSLPDGESVLLSR